MTISASRTRELDISTIVKRAMQTAGLMEPGASTVDPLFGPRREMAMDMLDSICKSVQNEAVIDRHVVRTTAAVTAASATVTLSTSAMMLLGKVMFAETGETYESPIQVVSTDDYNNIGDKTTTGTPSVALFNRQPTPTLTLWPVPDANGTVTYEYHTLAADVSLETDTLDFERHWTSFFIWELAHQLLFASGVALDRVGYARKRAETLLETAKAYSRNHQSIRFVSNHKTPWSP